MKKILGFFISVSLCAHSFADPTVARIYNKNSHYKMLINYEICASDDPGHAANDIVCDPPIKNRTFEKNQEYLQIPIPDPIFYVKVINAYQFDDEGLIRAYGEFPGKKNCVALQNKPISLKKDESRSRQMICMQTTT